MKIFSWGTQILKILSQGLKILNLENFLRTHHFLQKFEKNFFHRFGLILGYFSLLQQEKSGHLNFGLSFERDDRSQ